MPSISISKGLGSLNHNNRKFKTPNVDASRTHRNIVLVKPCQDTLQHVYHQLFDDALQKYNDRQKRADRKISNYLSHIQKSKQEKPFHELVVQIGNRENSHDSYAELLKEYCQGFEKRNPQMKIVGAVIHMDEATPHLHLDYVPYITGQKRGLETRVSNDKAIKQMGYDNWNVWKDNEVHSLEQVLERHGLERTIIGNTERHRTVDGYKQEQRAIERNLRAINEQQIDIPTPNVKKGFMGRETVDYEDYLRLQEQYQLVKKKSASLMGVNEALRGENKKLEQKLGFIQNKPYVAQNEVLRQDKEYYSFQNQNLSQEVKSLKMQNMKLRENMAIYKADNEELQRQVAGFKKVLVVFYYHVRNALSQIHMTQQDSSKFLDSILQKIFRKPSDAEKVIEDCRNFCREKDYQKYSKDKPESIRDRIQLAKQKQETHKNDGPRHKGMDLER